jgi:Alpha/beta hydrolase family
MTAFVLVHGAWGGAHGFRHVRRLLRSKQHDVSTPSLTGVGERIHLSSPLVGLGTHIRDVVNHILYEDLNEIVLMGFSYGGFVVTGALEHIAERVFASCLFRCICPKQRGDGCDASRARGPYEDRIWPGLDGGDRPGARIRQSRGRPIGWACAGQLVP